MSETAQTRPLASRAIQRATTPERATTPDTVSPHHAQLRAALRGQDFATQMAILSPIQRKANGESAGHGGPGVDGTIVPAGPPTVPTAEDFRAFEATLDPRIVRAVHQQGATLTVATLPTAVTQRAAIWFGAETATVLAAYLDYCRGDVATTEAARGDATDDEDGVTRTEGSTPLGVPAGDGSELALLDESPSGTVGYASWLLRARDAGFVRFKYHGSQVESLADGKRVPNLEADKNDVDILQVEVDLVKARIRKWLEHGGDKNPIAFGSMIRARGNPKKADVHSNGGAIDINDLSQTTTVEPVIELLLALDGNTDRSYGVGLPFQGEFFDPADDIARSKKKAEAEAGGASQISLNDKVQNGSTYAFDATASKRGAAWIWTTTKRDANTAYTRLKSAKLKSTFADLRTKGFSFDIFPDNDDHMHLDRR